MMQELLKILLLLFHLLYSFLLSVQSKFYSVIKNFRIVCDVQGVFDYPAISCNDNEKLLKYLQGASKIPAHLVIIMGNEPISYVDLAKLVTWSLPCGIAFVSFYDHKNVLSSNKLFDTVVKHNKDIISLIKWGKAFDQDTRNYSKQLINGFKWSPKIEVNVYLKEDGKKMLINTTANLCSGFMDVNSINESFIDACMKKNFSPLEPDLAIICGQTCSTFGFQPWILRVTEFLMLPSHHNLGITDFIGILKAFGKVEQRFGK